MEEKIVRESHRNEIIGFDFVAVDDVVVLVSQKIIVQRERERSTITHRNTLWALYNRRLFTIDVAIQTPPVQSVAHDGYNSIVIILQIQSLHVILFIVLNDLFIYYYILMLSRCPLYL